MISVVIYGRNDSHGYNLHKRAAISLNCIAQVLDDPDDEIIFVDYNTPPDMPTFVEAIRDTLTEDAQRLARVIRVPATIHAERFASRTHLVALEPVARNVGVRRSNPANRWILSTNTDMVFVPTGARSLSAIAADLDDGYYSIPRFDLPEALWEILDRTDPVDILERVADWGGSLYLDETITSYPWLAFDAPGDFQLVLRDRLFEMHGFDEEMLLGWHVDSNLARRHSVSYDNPRDLSSEVCGYHCDHTRVPGVAHTPERVANDLDRFVFDIERGDLPAQAESWGLPDLELQEIDLRGDGVFALPEALSAALPAPSGAPTSTDARLAQTLLWYRPEHVLPFVASALVVLPRTAVIGYVGANDELARPLACLLADLGFEQPLLVHDVGGVLRGLPGAVTADIATIARETDAVVFDFGLPRATASVAVPNSISDWPAESRRALGRVLSCLDFLARLDSGGTVESRPLRSYVVVNAIYNFLENVVDRRVVTASYQFNTRVRHGQAQSPLADDPSKMFALRAIGYGVPEVSWAPYHVGEIIDLWDPLPDGFLSGAWSWPDPDGIWTEGQVASIRFDAAPSEIDPRGHLVLGVVITGVFVPARSGELVVDVRVNGQVLDQWRFTPETRAGIRYVYVDHELLRIGSPVQVDFLVRDPVSPFLEESGPDPRRLGLRVSKVFLDSVAPFGQVGDRVAAVAPKGACGVLSTGWSYPEEGGTWSDGEESTIVIPAIETGEPEFDLVLEFLDVFIRDRGPVEVEVDVNGKQVQRWHFATRGQQSRRFTIPTTPYPTVVRLRFPKVCSPKELGESDDARSLALMLRGLRIALPGESTTIEKSIARLRLLVRRRLGRLGIRISRADRRRSREVRADR